MLAEIWEGSFVEENNLAQNISLLRKTLRTKPPDEKFIETVPKFGYRFVAEVATTTRTSKIFERRGRGYLSKRSQVVPLSNEI